ncbi:hypothetical protein DL546_005216 [Coniochaeta pulveracea]|uniref:molybdopterin adenylyltransferase n=1 Tax=Coniochaeta pulveracea TaxID=177199 RepID=A0A420YGZ9_9PEZI|nr:hypothetical protein DL546_005216 [Coniochaeta pulveracea]
MVLSYQAALSILDTVANGQKIHRRDAQQQIPLQEAVGRIVASDIVSAESTPAHDTSAMDGYAIRSEATSEASERTPVRFQVRGRIAAGDDPRQVLQGLDTAEVTMSGIEPCVEIMTGAGFPEGFDACVRFEDAETVIDCDVSSTIVVTKPVPVNANRRLAGNDIRNGDVILQAGMTLQVGHLLPLSSLGIKSIAVEAKPRVAVFSTGKELLSQSYGLGRDMNGPYLTAALGEIGADVDFCGVLDDDPTSMYRHLQTVAGSGAYEVIITSGAVSKGRFDHIPDVLAQMDAEILFHGVAMRPGHPVLFALLPAGGTVDGTAKRKTAFFGLPGNPGAAAACFRFLVVPYLRALSGQTQEAPVIASLVGQVASVAQHTVSCNDKRNGTATHASSPDIFRHGVLQSTPEGMLTVQPSKDQSPAKLNPFITANCWIHLPPHGHGNPKLEAGLVECYPISAATTGFPLTSLPPT